MSQKTDKHLVPDFRSWYGLAALSDDLTFSFLPPAPADSSVGDSSKQPERGGLISISRKQKKAQYVRLWHLAHKERVRAIHNKWRLAHPGAANVFSAKWRKNNRDKQRAAEAAWQKRHPEKVKLYAKRGRLKHKDKYRSYCQKRRAKKQGSAIGDLRAISLWESRWRHKRAVRCYWCLKYFRPTLCHEDHIIPLNKGGRHTIDNVCISCASCNLKKHDKAPKDWIASLEQPTLLV